LTQSHVLIGMNIKTGKMTKSYPVRETDGKPLKALSIMYADNLGVIYGFVETTDKIVKFGYLMLDPVGFSPIGYHSYYGG